MTAQVHINGETFEGFENGSLALTMEDVANPFDFEYVADGKALGQRAIFRGDACGVSLDAGGGAGPELLLSGFVNSTNDDDDPDLVKLAATVFSAPYDLYRGSALNRPGRWTNAKLDKIVQDICAPFAQLGGVSVEGDQGDPFATFSIQKGETSLDAISRAALQRGYFPYSVGAALVLARAGTSRTKTTLVRGDKRLMRSGRSDSEEGRYSEYVLKGQARPTDDNFAANASQLGDTVVDESLGRYVPLYLQAAAGSKKDLKTRAKLERNQRAGKSERITALVNGWGTDEGTCWRPNTLVRFVNPVLGVDSTLLIVRAGFRFGANEPKQTELTMTRPEAFDLDDYPALGRGESWT